MVNATAYDLAGQVQKCGLEKARRAARRPLLSDGSTLVWVARLLLVVGLALTCGAPAHLTAMLLCHEQSLKLEALLFLRQSMESHAPAMFHPSIRGTIEHVTACVAEDWYKVHVPLATPSAMLRLGSNLSVLGRGSM